MHALNLRRRWIHYQRPSAGSRTCSSPASSFPGPDPSKIAVPNWGWAPGPGHEGETMQAEVKGTTMPLLEMILESGESIISSHGELSWMSPNVQLSQTTATGGQ